MKLLRNKGRSYTDFTETPDEDGDTGSLGRGVEVKQSQLLTHPTYAGDAQIRPDRLSDYLSEDYVTVLRHVVSHVDKVIQKRGSLRAIHIDAYVDRTLLAKELWRRLRDRLEDEIRNLPNGDAAFAKYEETWNWKVHPYARHAADLENPRGDGNADIILKAWDSIADPKPLRSDFEGRWHRAFWRVGADGRPDYGAIADKIIAHLFDQEQEIRGPIAGALGPFPRKKKGQARPATGEGLMLAHGRSIAKSANDPRAERPKEKQKNWGPEEVARYFKTDIAAAIYADLAVDPECGAAGRRRSHYSKRFGSLLYDHFGLILDQFRDDKDAKYRFWSLHNTVREFYQSLAKSDRFWIAERSASPDADRKGTDRFEQLRKIVPHDKDALVRTLDAKAQNASVSELIRLGKLVVHAADMLDDRNEPNQAFQRRLDYLVTSAGQSEIKRNEAFTRVWRNSVALSLRTLKAWVDPAENVAVPAGRARTFLNEDLAGTNVAVRAVNDLNPSQYRQHASLIFGDLDVGGKSRASLFRSDERAKEQEHAWGFLRLAAEIRNRTNHFSTKQRVVKLVTEGVLRAAAGPNDRRKSEFASQGTLAAFASLLEFDIALQRHVLANELNRLGAACYVIATDRPRLFTETASFAKGTEVPTPKFMSVLRRVSDLAKNDLSPMHGRLRHFASLDISNLSKGKPTRGADLTEEAERQNLNQCRVGLLRILYAAGFQSWLRSQAAPRVQECAKQVVASKRKRALDYQKGHERFYRSAQTLLDELALDSIEDLTDLFQRLTSHAADDRRINRSYAASRDRQREVANWVEEFRQEVYAHLFAEYLADLKLEWIWDIKDQAGDDASVTPVTPTDIILGDGLGEPQPWHAQFYAWLYLVPIDDIALLRHQFLKTEALERKAAGQTDERLVGVLGQMTWLMGLYTRVQSAGFQGDEHTVGNLLQETLYEDPELYNTVYAPEMEDLHIPYPGTRRGLRQMLRFGHYAILQSNLEKHPVTRKEVDKFAGLKSGEVRALFERKNNLHKQAIDLMKAARPEMAALAKVAEDYEGAASEAALYNFAVSGARLTDHARLHQLMMRIVGRLADFTGMWERDRAYLLLGMLYRKIGPEYFNVDVRTLGGADYPDSIVVRLPGDLAETLRNGLASTPAVGVSTKHVRSVRDAMANGMVPLWDDHRGFQLDGFGALAGLLDEPDRALFQRYFKMAPEENPKDVEARRRIERMNADLARQGRPEGKPRRSDYQIGKEQIRHDFAHYNVISTRLSPARGQTGTAGEDEGQRVDRRNRVNMSYLVNAVRSLLSYDRKLKNAVSKAIADILLDEGVVIEWTLYQDRLVRAQIMPKLELHLTMGRTNETREIAFGLPQASVRFTSMVKALFDFESGGYRLPVGAEKKRRGVLGYPPQWKSEFKGKIPAEVLNYELPAMKQKQG